MTKKGPAKGQQHLGAPPKIIAVESSKPRVKQDIRSLWSGWQTVICAQAKYRRIPKPSEEVNVSLLDRMFLECLDYNEAINGEELWIKCYEQTGYQIGPRTFVKWVGKLVDRGLIERVE